MSQRCFKSAMESIFIVLINISFLSAQEKAVINQDDFTRLFHLLQSLHLDGCIEDVPAPTVFREPRYTQGTSNIICFRLPDPQTVPFPEDTLKSPFVMTLVNSASLDLALKFPRPVSLLNGDRQFESVGSLQTGERYEFTTALFLPVCNNADCDDISEIHCSAYQDTVWSIQDSVPPVVQNVGIPQLDASPVAGWTNQSVIDLTADLTDPAGVWQGFLFRRNCSESGWEIQVSDSTFASTLTDSGFEFSEFAAVSFKQNLADGCYEFRVEGKDATHTPESCFPDFELAGNGGQPLNPDPPQIVIRIDATPPGEVTLNCEQNMNTINLSWSAATDPIPGIGLAGYHILKDNQLLASVAANVTEFSEDISLALPETEFVYQVQPFDSLKNVQMNGGSANCIYKPVSQIALTAEPEFTAGIENQICWTGSPTIDSYSVFAAADCNFDKPISGVATDTCFTFSDLLDGVNYCYWVTAVDQQGRSVFSDTVMSIQDATVPEISSFEIAGKINLGSGDWVKSREIELILKASDVSPGLLQTFLIFENSSIIREELLSFPIDQVETVLRYTIQSDECQAIDVSVRVMDAAGNTSLPVSMTLKLDETEPEPVAQLNCQQLSGENGIRLQWTPSSEPPECSGLKEYVIIRDGDFLTTVNPNITTYDDILSADTPTSRFSYQIQPRDSLDKIQTSGGQAECDYSGAAVIAIESMDKFSPGLENEICWQVTGDLVSLKVLLDSDGDFVAEDSSLFDNPTQVRACHEFRNLNGGQTYHYWILGVDSQQRTSKSDTVLSIQDNTRPNIVDFSLPDGEKVNNQIWAYSKDVELNIVASDASPGEISRYELFENDAMKPGFFSEPATNLSENFRYSLQTAAPNATRIALEMVVFDAAGNSSDPTTLIFYLHENPPGLFAFPNPFNPMQKGTTIRVKDTNETEIRIYDFFGNLVQALTEKTNNHDFVWDGKNGNGDYVANGGYVCVGTKSKTRFKIAVIKR